MTRKELRSKMSFNNKEIQKLRDKNDVLYKKYLLLSDDEQWFKEEKETIGRGKRKQERLVGRIYWSEDFEDKGTGETITIDRNQVIRVDGEWRI